jgi:hypothetical protein
MIGLGRASRRFLREVSLSLNGESSYLIYLMQFITNVTVNFTTIKWCVSIESRSQTDMIF